MTTPKSKAPPEPLRVIILRHRSDKEATPYEDAVVRVLQGGQEPSAYIVSGTDLGIQIGIFGDEPTSPPDDLLDAFCHTLVIVLVDDHLLAATDNFRDWIADCFQHIDASGGRHAMLSFAMEERFANKFAGHKGLEKCQIRTVQSLGEAAIRPAKLALRAMHTARILLANALPLPDGSPKRGHLTLFISHAKMDGLPLATALDHHITSYDLEDYYDARDLPPGSNWHKELEAGVSRSLIIILRTEMYETRYWCQQEVRWADEYATPALLIELRTGLNHPAATLPFDRVPAVRIPDGNLLRVLILAVREGLAFLLFQRRIQELQGLGGKLHGVPVRAFSFQPSMAALLRACRSLAAEKKPGYILYPDPVFASGTYEAANALVTVEASGTTIATPNTLAVAVPR